ncbi:MAG: TonB-dependent receptor [Verrucomicrobiota bacterium]
MKKLHPLVAGLALLLPGFVCVASEPGVALPPYVVTASRAPQAPDELPVATDVFGFTQLHNSPSLKLDDTLRGVAAFSLFRRSSSLIANPTAQGVSLRNLGPSGASRSLVLLDGIPLNDPFGGWVAWSAVPMGSLDRVEIVRGGGSGVWGNSALSGVVQLFSATPADRVQSVSAAAGEFGLRTGEINASETAGHDSLGLSLSAFAFDGFDVVGPLQRGPVDRPLDSEHQTARLSWRRSLGDQTSLQVSGQFFHENRGNGTVLQKNSSESGQLALSLAGAISPRMTWNAGAYVQEETFASFFSSVNATRTAETPANDQYAVPAAASGASFTVAAQGDQSTTTGGADVRWVQGETREKFFFSAGQFTRLREAGGEQYFTGAFLNHERAWSEAWRASAGLRLDAWSNDDGHRHESNALTGATTRDDHYVPQHGFELSPQLGLVWSPAPGLKVRASAYQAFRVPTLNEYYRPFRVGAVTTEANPALKPEHLTGGELGFELSQGSARLTATAFADELQDAVSNVTLTPTSRQRMNLDRVTVEGVELAGEWRPLPTLRVHADSVLSDARVRRATVRPTLEGRRLAQTPGLTFTTGIDWQVRSDWRLTSNLRYASEQFEDDDNTLVLAPMTTVDLGVTKSWGSHFELSLLVENLLDLRIETGRSPDGIVTLGQPRMARLAARWTW